MTGFQLDATQLQAYLRRVGLPEHFRDGAEADLQTLRQLHAAHTRSIPFENLSLHGYPQFTANCRVPGIPVSLHPLDLLDKMVKHRRGGFCYENNGLFGLVLHALGFDFYAVSVRVLVGERKEVEGKPWQADSIAWQSFSHQAHMVLLDGQKWLADVGGADCTSAWPLPLSDTQPDGHVRLHRGELPHGNPGWGVQMLTSRGWGPDNFFVYDRSALPVESELGAYCAATHPHSMMVNEQLAFIVDQQGRKSYADNLIKVFEFSKGTRPVQVLPVTPDNRAQLLLEHFGIEPASAHES